MILMKCARGCGIQHVSPGRVSVSRCLECDGELQHDPKANHRTELNRGKREVVASLFEKPKPSRKKRYEVLTRCGRCRRTDTRLGKKPELLRCLACHRLLEILTIDGVPV